jgi:hypothetical protein
MHRCPLCRMQSATVPADSRLYLCYSDSLHILMRCTESQMSLGPAVETTPLQMLTIATHMAILWLLTKCSSLLS